MSLSVKTKVINCTPGDLLGRPLNDVERKYAPPQLYVASNRPIPLPGPRFAIVGSRRASKEGIATAEHVAYTLAKKDVIIVSGLAEGIDSAAHRAAMEYGGSTIAVLGTPLDKFYPAKNKELQRKIMSDHWAISQFPIGYPTEPKSFVIRNRTMALICDASVIIETGETSGSLHQGWEALRLGRPLFIWKKILEDSGLKWPHEMVDYGAVVLENAEQIIDFLPSPNRIVEIAA